MQDTGFSAWLETGAGLLAFSSPDDAAAGAEEIDRRYAFHCRAAREAAEQWFDSGAVLGELLEGTGM